MKDILVLFLNYKNYMKHQSMKERKLKMKKNIMKKNYKPKKLTKKDKDELKKQFPKIGE